MTGAAATWRTAVRIAAATPAMRGAAAVWVGVVAGDRSSVTAALLVAVVVAIAALRDGRALPAALLAAGLVAGAAAAERSVDEVHPPAGQVFFEARVIADAVVEEGRSYVLVAANPGQRSLPGGLKLRVATDDVAGVVVGSTVEVAGELRNAAGWFGRHRYTATVTAAAITRTVAPSVVVRVGNGLRHHLLGNIETTSPGRALLRGLLVGDTTALGADDIAALRSTGLAHFVAVSGSNVALVVAGWWLLAGLFGIGLPGRTGGALVVVMLFVIVTRWEPSVVRAAVMAGFVLLARLAGYPLTAWQALGGAVAVVLLVSPELAGDVGFQLSVAATGGVLVAATGRSARRPRLRVLEVAATTLRITLAAQIAVLPIVLARFGEAPLLSPVANLVAAPLVTLATVLGGIGALSGLSWLVAVAAAPAHGVLEVAALAASWPQLDLASASSLVVGAAAWLVRPLRPMVVTAAAAVLTVWLVPQPGVGGASVVFLDVGQGDAILVRSGSGHDALIDGGAYPALLRTALARHGVGDLDVVVVTHGDSDHAGGLRSLTDHVEVGMLVHPGLQPVGELLGLVIEEAAASGASVGSVVSGDRVRLGSVRIDVLGPHRRFAAENDGSVVTLVSHEGVSVLLTGDIEAVGQAELPPVAPDVVQVPHHGSATTELRWLLDTVGEVAVVSVGPNRHGHPHPDVMAALSEVGVRVLTTWEHGDVIVPLAG